MSIFFCKFASDLRTSEPNSTSTMPDSILLRALKPGPYRWDFVLFDDYLGGQAGELLGGRVEVKATLNLRATDYDLHLAVEGEVRVPCDRCLEPMALPVGVEETLFSPDEEGTPLDEEGQLDIAWLAYETIIVHLPLVHSHQPGGCNPKMVALLQDHLCTTDSPEDDDNKE